MAKPIFIWSPDEGAEENIKPSVNVAKFGDGYEQRTVNGINSEVISWSLTFTGANADIAPIRNFLRQMGAAQSFQWTNPFGELGIYVAREFKQKKIKTAVTQITVTFDRVYEQNV